MAAAGKGRKGAWLVLALLAVGAAAAGLLTRKRDAARPALMADLVKPGAAEGFNVLLITLDTTRPDHLGCYGYQERVSPALDSLLAHGVRFDDAVASAPLTLPSHATILTGLYPPSVGVRDNGTYQLKPEYATLAEMLKERGYDTAAFIASFVLDRRFGLDQGFGHYDFKVAEDSRAGTESLQNERRADGVSNSMLEWLGRRQRAGESRPFFAWVHYYDPHHPYDSPIASEARFHGKPAYDAEIAFMDRHIQRILDALDKHKLRERTLIAVVSDHGESLSEHNEPHHGIFIYESTMRVALMLSSPALFSGAHRVDDRLVGTVDVTPTILDLVGAPVPAGLDGVSLLDAQASADRALYIESYYPREKLGCSPLYGLRRRGEKFILAPKPEYYDLRRDARELDNRYASGADAVSRLSQELQERLTRWNQEGTALAGARATSAQEQQALESLGYAGQAKEATSKELPDPKDQLAIINQMSEVKHLREAGRYEEALSLAREVAAQCDGFDGPVLNVAWLYVKLNQRPRAIEVLDEYAQRHPSADVLIALAKELAAEKRWDEMERALQAAEIKDPRRGSIAELRGDRLVQEQRYREAAEAFEQALRMDSERIGPAVREKLAHAQAMARTAGG